MSDRTESIQIRLTKEEKAGIEKQAKDAEVSLSRFVREKLLGEPDVGPEDPLAAEASVDVKDLPHQLMPQSPEHLKRFPGDKHTDAQRIAFSGLTAEFIRQGLPVPIAKRQAATQIFSRKEAA